MGKGSKPNKATAPDGSLPSPASRAQAAEAARKRTGKSKTAGFPWLSSLAMLAVAIGLTLTFTTSPPQAPGVDPKPAASRDAAFAPQDRTSQCSSWVRDGECENNAAFMQERCPGACPKKAARKAAPSTPKPAAPLDANPNCITWASGGECVSNPQYMLGECPHACAAAARGEEVGGDAEDIHQDCAAWVQDGECFRNPAFMLQQCKASCSKFAAANDDILQDTSDSCVNFALRGGCVQDIKKADTICRASCYIQRICANHTETVTCSKALRCEAIGDKSSDCAVRAAQGKCASDSRRMLKECLKSCSEVDLAGTMRFHLPHERTHLSPYIDLPGSPPRLAGFYSTPPQSRNNDLDALALCDPDDGASSGRIDVALSSTFARRVRGFRKQLRWRQRWNRYHWSMWELSAGRERTPRVPHLFKRIEVEGDEVGSKRVVTVQHVSYSPRIRYIHRLLSAAECEHVLKVAMPLFTRSPVRGSVTRVRTSTTAMLGGRYDDAVVKKIRQRIALFSGYDAELIEPLQVVRYERGQKYEGHHDFFDVCDLEDKSENGRRQVTFLIYLVDMPADENGGGTRFPELSIEVAPEQGSAIVFNDCFDNGEEDGRSLHAGQPPLQPGTVKYAINGWIRARPVNAKMGRNLFSSILPG